MWPSTAVGRLSCRPGATRRYGRALLASPRCFFVLLLSSSRSCLRRLCGLDSPSPLLLQEADGGGRRGWRRRGDGDGQPLRQDRAGRELLDPVDMENGWMDGRTRGGATLYNLVLLGMGMLLRNSYFVHLPAKAGRYGTLMSRSAVPHPWRTRLSFRGIR